MSRFTAVLPTFAAMHCKLFPGYIGGVDNTLSSSAIAGELSNTAAITNPVIFFISYPPYTNLLQKQPGHQGVMAKSARTRRDVTVPAEDIRPRSISDGVCRKTP